MQVLFSTFHNTVQLIVRISGRSPTSGASANPLQHLDVRSYPSLSTEKVCQDPLNDVGLLKEQLDKLPNICRFQYKPVADFIISNLDPIFSHYQVCIFHIAGFSVLTLRTQELISTAPPMPQGEILQRMTVIESKLTWIVYIVSLGFVLSLDPLMFGKIGSVISGYAWSDPTTGDKDQTFDAELSRRVLQLTQVVDYRLSKYAVYESSLLELTFHSVLEVRGR